MLMEEYLRTRLEEFMVAKRRVALYPVTDSILSSQASWTTHESVSELLASFLFAGLDIA